MTWTFKHRKNFPTLKSVRRSKLEDNIEKQLVEAGVEYTYEKDKVEYVVPSRKAKYIPDFRIGDIYIEGKGTFQRRGASGSVQERQKLLLVKEQNPGMDIRIVFQNANQAIYKGSKTTLAQWAADNGFPFSSGGVVPSAWITEARQQIAIKKGEA